MLSYNYGLRLGWDMLCCVVLCCAVLCRALVSTRDAVVFAWSTERKCHVLLSILERYATCHHDVQHINGVHMHSVLNTERSSMHAW